MKQYPIRHQKNEVKNATLEGGKFAFGVFTGFAIFLLLYLSVPLDSFINYIAKRTLHLPVFVSLAVATLSAYIAYRALSEQKRSREAGTDPVLIAHLGQREDAKELVTFKVSNVGAGAAVNVKLEVSEPEGGIGGRTLVTNVFHRHHPFTVILQDSSIEFSFGFGWDLLGNEPLAPFVAELVYEDLSGEIYEGSFTIDVRQMEGLGAEKSPHMRMVKSLEDIAKKIK